MSVTIGAEADPADCCFQNFKIVSIAFIEIILDFLSAKFLKFGCDCWNIDVKDFGFVFGHELMLSTVRANSKTSFGDLYFQVGDGRLELPASASRTLRSTN